MKLKKLAQIMLVSCSLLALSACSSMHHKGPGNVAVNDADAGAQASGIGSEDSFGHGDEGSDAHMASNNNKTYYFDFDRSDVREADKPAIIANANKLVSHPNQKIRLEGHTDPRGSREYNIALAERRAKAVNEILSAQGVGENQVRIVSYGSERPAAQGHTEQDYQLDRRAVIDSQN